MKQWKRDLYLSIGMFLVSAGNILYGIALKGMGDDAKFGAAGLIMAILGGSILPPLQACIIDMKEIGCLPAVNVSFILPFICFLVISGYGYRTLKRNW